MTTSVSDTPVNTPKRLPQRLRRELFWALALKLVLLLSLKAAFFPQRLPAAEAAQGVADRLAASTPAAETISKEQP